MDTCPYGTWPSPVTPEMLTEGVVLLDDVWVDDEVTFWSELRPSEGGRVQVVRQGADGVPVDVLPEGFNARTGAHEYGGGAVLVEAGAVWFVNWADQRLYVILDGAAPVALTAAPAVPRSVRWADMCLSPDREWIVCVREAHDGESAEQVRNELVALRAHVPSEPVVLFAGTDFVMSPTFVDATRLRWIGWDHPNMPWHDTQLYESSFDTTDGTAVGVATVLSAGHSIMQPVGEWVLDDRTNWWNVWRIDSHAKAVPVAPMVHDIGEPAWVFGMRNFAITGAGMPVFAVDGDVHVGDEVTVTDAVSLSQWVLHDGGRTATVIADYADRRSAIVRFPLEDPLSVTTVVAGCPLAIDIADVSRARRISYPTTGGRVASGLYYAPVNSRCEAPSGTAPPLVVMIHGGPTAAAGPQFTLTMQFWTTRGFAVVDVDYGGSSGYGRAVRNELDGQWGIVDVDDCCAAAEHLASLGLADPHRLVIRGGSAGGFTVLAALARRDVFAAGASYFGVADLAALAADTHKFESRYLDRLVGPWPAARAVYEERSPIHHVDGFDRPLIVFQGLDDKVVPPNQSEMIVAALRAKGVECEYHAYEGEGHGFRKAENISDSLRSELEFFQRTLGLV
jgi:dipeptidyl aminopeptidase/acylaminoacyl peptidase